MKRVNGVHFNTEIEDLVCYFAELLRQWKVIANQGLLKIKGFIQDLRLEYYEILIHIANCLWHHEDG